MRMRQVYGDGEVRALLSFKYATVLLQKKSRLKQRTTRRSLQAKLELQGFQLKEKEMEESLFRNII